jgi:hypothetical protein
MCIAKEVLLSLVAALPIVNCLTQLVQEEKQRLGALLVQQEGVIQELQAIIQAQEAAASQVQEMGMTCGSADKITEGLWGYQLTIGRRTLRRQTLCTSGSRKRGKC